MVPAPLNRNVNLFQKDKMFTLQKNNKLSLLPLHFSDIAASVWNVPPVAYCESKSLAEMLTTVSYGNIITFGTVDLFSSGEFLVNLMQDGNSSATSKLGENVRKTPS